MSIESSSSEIGFTSTGGALSQAELSLAAKQALVTEALAAIGSTGFLWMVVDDAGYGTIQGHIRELPLQVERTPDTTRAVFNESPLKYRFARQLWDTYSGIAAVLNPEEAALMMPNLPQLGSAL